MKKSAPYLFAIISIFYAISGFATPITQLRTSGVEEKLSNPD